VFVVIELLAVWRHNKPKEQKPNIVVHCRRECLRARRFRAILLLYAACVRF